MRHPQLFSVLQISNVYHWGPSDELAGANSEHEPLPRLVKATAFCLCFEFGTAPAQLSLDLLVLFMKQEVGLALCTL